MAELRKRLFSNEEYIDVFFEGQSLGSSSASSCCPALKLEECRLDREDIDSAPQIRRFMTVLN
jgi:hypothetical protein